MSTEQMLEQQRNLRNSELADAIRDSGRMVTAAILAGQTNRAPSHEFGEVMKSDTMSMFQFFLRWLEKDGLE